MKGTSYTYFTTDNSKSARELIAILREAKAHVPPQLEEMAMYSGGGGRSLYSFIEFVSSIDLIRIGRYGGGGGGRGRGGGSGGGGGSRYGGGGHDNYGNGNGRDRW